MSRIVTSSKSDSITVAYAKMLLAAVKVRQIEDRMRQEHLSKLDYENGDIDELVAQSFAISREHGYYIALDELAGAKMAYKAARKAVSSVA